MSFLLSVSMVLMQMFQVSFHLCSLAHIQVNFKSYMRLYAQNKLFVIYNKVCIILTAEQEMLMIQLPEQPPNPHLLKVAIIGTPNVGKSTLINSLLGRRVSTPVARTITNFHLLKLHHRHTKCWQIYSIYSLLGKRVSTVARTTTQPSPTASCHHRHTKCWHAQIYSYLQPTWEKGKYSCQNNHPTLTYWKFPSNAHAM